jgi:hypothetical protein
MRNKSFHFIMPLLNFPAHYPDSGGFINTYTKHSDHPDRSSYVFILCDSSKLNGNGQVNYNMRNHPCYVGTTLYSSTGYELLSYDLGKEFKEDLLAFRRGAYSAMSENAKEKILRIFIGMHLGKITKNWAALYPTNHQSIEFVEELEERIGCELTGNFEIISKPNLENETFKLSDLFEMYESHEPDSYLVLR